MERFPGAQTSGSVHLTETVRQPSLRPQCRSRIAPRLHTHGVAPSAPTPQPTCVRDCSYNPMIATMAPDTVTRPSVDLRRRRGREALSTHPPTPLDHTPTKSLQQRTANTWAPVTLLRPEALSYGDASPQRFERLTQPRRGPARASRSTTRTRRVPAHRPAKTLARDSATPAATPSSRGDTSTLTNSVRVDNSLIAESTMGRQSRAKRQRRRARLATQRLTRHEQRYPVNTEYVRPAHAVTPSEGYLQELCKRTFLSLWSYPNPHRDQGGGNHDGKEICDLLVVFENNVIIFSDKHCQFPSSGNLHLDWSRWYRRAIQASARQLWGAERWIRDHPDRVFLDTKCTKRFPLSLVTTPTTVFHRVVVAHGAAARCIRELGGSGSLMLNSTVVGSAHIAPRAKGGTPFMVGQVDATKGYVHVLDDTTFSILLETLDTVADLSVYLKKKENFIKSGIASLAAGEEELLAHYLTHLNTDGEYDFVFEKDVVSVTFDEGLWQDFVNSPERAGQLKANRISYVWDDIIERFTHHFLHGTSHYLSDTKLSSHELILRFFAREPRLRRRMLASTILDMVQTTPPHLRRLRVLPPTRPGDPYFVMLILPKPSGRSLDQYREVRRRYLEACCRVVKLDFPDALDVVGLASETSATVGRSEDAVYLDARLWTEEMASETARDKAALSILTAANRIQRVERDYPI